ncbi:MAG: alpha/beta hydrolase [Streptosporangiaceae bacterium]|jgi:enterochelin esterase-like enzyme
MGLTSRLFIDLVIAAAIAGVAATAWLWPRLAAQRPGPVLARLSLVAVSQVLAVIALLAYVNGYFMFFSSWSALFGGGSVPVAAAGGGGAVPRRLVTVTGTDLGPVPGGSSVLPEAIDGRLAAKSPRYYAAHHTGTKLGVAGGLALGGGVGRAVRSVGEVLQVTIRGARTGISTGSSLVYLPPQYFQPAYARARFPVVLALTGYPNATWSIVKFLALPATAARLTAGGKIRPAIYVMMNVSVALPRDTECTNIPAGPQVESFFGEDVPQAIEQNFRVQAGPSGWAALGYSTGGYCAAKLAMMNPYQFSSAVAMSGYYQALTDSMTGQLYGRSRAYREENNLDWRLRHLPAPPVSVLATASRAEGIYRGTRGFLRLIHPPMQGYSLVPPQGGHNYGTWGRELPQCLEWLSRRLSPARPRPVRGAPSSIG